MSYEFNTTKSFSQGRELLNLKLSPEQDLIAEEIAQYIADGLNYYYYQNYERLAVKNILSYDAIITDNSQFPLLKVYRLNDRFKQETQMRISTMVITYSLLVPEQNKLPGLLSWVSNSFNHLLDSFHHNHRQHPYNVVLADRTGEYRILLNEINRYAYPFFRMEFNLEEQDTC